MEQCRAVPQVAPSRRKAARWTGAEHRWRDRRRAGGTQPVSLCGGRIVERRASVAVAARSAHLLPVTMTTILAGALARDLRALRREIEAYGDERDLWKPLPGITNTAGTLVLHLAGNLQHFVGAVLGGSGYERDREAEFARRDVPRQELLQLVDRSLGVVEGTLPTLPEERLAEPYPQAVGGVTVTTGDFLVHLATHLAYHLGQLDYHRRIATGESRTVGAQSPAELATARRP
jgi:uncharacterized damage-inducible protein DinB